LNNAEYDINWVGIDAGREGLWQEPIWTSVLEIVSMHEGEKVYDPKSEIYPELIKAFPSEKWCSLTPEKHFRPLFRDYPNSWTRTGVISLQDRVFRLTSLGRRLLNGQETKQRIFIGLFSKHIEENTVLKCHERPFAIVAQAFLDTPRPLSAKEVYWVVMKNYRPERQKFMDALLKKAEYTPPDPDPTPFRRVRHMLQLLRTTNAIMSFRRSHDVFWDCDDNEVLKKIIYNTTENLIEQ